MTIHIHSQTLTSFNVSLLNSGLHSFDTSFVYIIMYTSFIKLEVYDPLVLLTNPSYLIDNTLRFIVKWPLI